MERLEADTYSLCLIIAKSYYRLIKRQKEIEQDIIFSSRKADGRSQGNAGNPTALKAERILLRQKENERKIKAIEHAWSGMLDDCEKIFIKKNLFERIPMQYIDLPMSFRTMKRVRKKFLIALAMNLYEI